MSFANLDDPNLMNNSDILLHQSITNLTYPLQLIWFIDWYNLDMSIFPVLVCIFEFVTFYSLSGCGLNIKE
jgi:hypothetical protein